MRVACVQLDSGEGAGTRDDRLARIRQLLAGERVELVVLPELWPIGFFQFDDYETQAEPLDGPTLTAIAALAVDLDAHVHAGSIIERRGDGRLSNTSVLFAPDGRQLLAYRKRHLFGYRSREAELLVPGDEIETVATPFGRVALTTCYDLRFPELYFDLVAQGAELALVASAWPYERLDHWRLLTRTRALENLMYVVASNASGTDGGVRFAGHSVVVDPWGEIIAEAGADEEVLVAELDDGRVDEVRSSFPVLEDRLRSAGVSAADSPLSRNA